MTTTRHSAWPRAWAAGLAVLALVAACGGSVGSGGTGAPMGSLSVGTVNGFGSVIVDGVRFDDTQAASVAETAPGVDELTEVKMGDRVEVAFEGTNTAKAVRVEAALIGAVATVEAPGRFVVLGQTVVVNGDPAAGPVTQLGGGYASVADVAAGDAVEVHGLLVQRNGGWVTQATRIERRSALPAYLKVTGVVSGLGASGAKEFKIGVLSVHAATATVLPADHHLADGEVVAVLAAVATSGVDGAGAPQLIASQVRIKKLPTDDSEAYVSGAISSLDTAAHTFLIDDLTVSYDGAALTPATATLAAGKYVRVFGTLRSDGTLGATAITILDGSSEPEAELKGTITGYSAATQTFTIRDVLVDATQASFEGCPSTGLADGLFAEVHGDLSSTRVLATEVHCESEPSGGIVEREGTASAVDTGARTFTLTHDGVDISVTWTADTYFRDVTPETLAGKRLSVEGVQNGSVFTATKIKLET